MFRTDSHLSATSDEKLVRIAGEEGRQVYPALKKNIPNREHAGTHLFFLSKQWKIMMKLCLGHPLGTGDG